ncbi:MAG: pntAA, partial [Propionibacteriaceae bacterium]|nr:pntAA [Propionibacteriaceae bacterium]
MRIAVARELAPGEARVALVPDLVGKLRAAGYDVAVQAGAGAAAFLADTAYEAAGALVTEHPFDEADLVLSVQPLDAECL